MKHISYVLCALLCISLISSCNSDDDTGGEVLSLANSIWEGQEDSTILINFITESSVTLEVPNNNDEGVLSYTFDGSNGEIIFPNDEGILFEVQGAVLTTLNTSLGSPGEDTFIRRD